MKKSLTSSPIGIFDSGIGGLTVFKAVRRGLPDEDIVYFGDTARVPYGTKSKETITKFSIENVHFLQSFDVKMVVVPSDGVLPASDFFNAPLHSPAVSPVQSVVVF